MNRLARAQAVERHHALPILWLQALPSEFDSRVKAMEVDEKPTEEFNDVGGLDTQIQELIEAVVLPMTHKVSTPRHHP